MHVLALSRSIPNTYEFFFSWVKQVPYHWFSCNYIICECSCPLKLGYKHKEYHPSISQRCHTDWCFGLWVLRQDSSGKNILWAFSSRVRLLGLLQSSPGDSTPPELSYWDSSRPHPGTPPELSLGLLQSSLGDVILDSIMDSILHSTILESILTPF